MTTPPTPQSSPNVVACCADGDHNVRIFDTLPEGDFIDETRPLPPQPSCAKPAPFYKGLKELQVRPESLQD